MLVWYIILHINFSQKKAQRDKVTKRKKNSNYKRN